MLKAIDVNKIDPSPFQIRKSRGGGKLKELGASIVRDSRIGPIVVRRNGGMNYELIVGHRRVEAVREYTKMKIILALIIKVDDLHARRISAAENLQLEDLSAVETIEAIVEIVDAELISDKEYASMGKKPQVRVKALLGKLDFMRRTKDRGYNVSEEIYNSSHKFVGRVEQIFKNLPKPLEWRSFYNHDLPILVDICEDVKKGRPDRVQ